MKLNDLRKYTIREQTQISYRLGNGMECVIDAAGIARVPGLRAIPDFNLEDELTSASEFTLDSRPGESKRLTRQQVEQLTAAGKSTAAAAHEEEE